MRGIERMVCELPVDRWTAPFRVSRKEGYYCTEDKTWAVGLTLEAPPNYREPWQRPYESLDSYVQLVAHLHFWYGDTSCWAEIRQQVERVVSQYRWEVKFYLRQRSDVYDRIYDLHVERPYDLGYREFLRREAREAERQWDRKNSYPSKDTFKESFARLRREYPFPGDVGTNPLLQSYVSLVSNSP